jgi:hypothetical protein
MLTKETPQMDAIHIDRIAKLFAARRLSRRQALTQSGAGLAAGALAAAGLARTARAQDATPPATGADGEKVEYLFVQSFRSGTIAPKEGEDGTFALTLADGLGQTIYFSDRPERIVGAAATAKLLAGLGFSPDDPPNAALVVEPGLGETDVAVIELSNPTYDEATHTATYDVTVLQDWEDSLEMGFSKAPADLSALAPTFGAAHLFIDDCPDITISCRNASNGSIAGSYKSGTCWDGSRVCCFPCEGYDGIKQRCEAEYGADASAHSWDPTAFVCPD